MDSSIDADTKSSTERTRRQESSEYEDDYVECLSALYQDTKSSTETTRIQGFSISEGDYVDLSSLCQDTKSSTETKRRREFSITEGDYLECLASICQHHTSPGAGLSSGCTGCLSPQPELLKKWLAIDFNTSVAALDMRLMFAVNYKREDTVEWLLQKKHVNPNYDIDGRSPIGCAVRIGHLEIVKLLLEAGAHVETVDHGDRLFQSYSLLHIAACYGRLELLQLLVSHGANINKRDYRHCTPLHMAALFGYSHLVKWLLSAGASANVLQSNSMSPLHIASIRGHMDVCRVLIEAGAFPSFCDVDGWTALHSAVAYDQEGIVKLLLKAGTDMSIRISSINDTLLHIACDIGSVGIIRLLLTAGMSIESRNVEGDTPLLTSAGNSDIYIAYFLIKAGANVNAVNNAGMTAIGLLFDREKTGTLTEEIDNLVQIFIEAGAKLSKENCRHCKDDTWLEEHADLLVDPQPLQVMCHLVIRQALAPDLQMKVFRLPLPSAIKRALALDDVGLHALHPDHGMLAANVNADESDMDNIVFSFKGLAFERLDNVD